MVLSMDLNESNNNLQYIANCVCDVINDVEYKTSQYELFVDLMLSSVPSDIDESKDSMIALRDAIGQLNSKLLAKYDLDCELFDNANPLDCFQPKYSICKTPSFCDYAELYVSVLAMECMLVQNGSLDAKFSGHSIKREFLSVLGRFMFLHHGFIKKEIDDEQTNYPDIFVQIFSHVIRIACSLSWSHEEYPQFRIFLLNLFDALSIEDKEELRTLINLAMQERQAGALVVSEDNVSMVFDAMDKYYAYLSRDNNISEIKVSWLFAYIYKKRFGFIFCKKFAKCANTSSLPYKFHAFTPAFKNATFVQVYNGPKVVLFDAGENKRSSEYVPTQSSAFYNAASGMFE